MATPWWCSAQVARYITVSVLVLLKYPRCSKGNAWTLLTSPVNKHRGQYSHIRINWPTGEARLALYSHLTSVACPSPSVACPRIPCRVLKFTQTCTQVTELCTQVKIHLHSSTCNGQLEYMPCVLEWCTHSAQHLSNGCFGSVHMTLELLKNYKGDT